MAKRAVLLLSFIIGTLALAPITVIDAPTTKADDSYRLDGSILPRSYVLSIQTYFDTNDDRAFTFDGNVTIHFETTVNNLYEIVLHAQDLAISGSDISLISSTGVTVTLNNETPIQLDPTYSFLKINLANPLSTSLTYYLTISYIGQIRNDMAGFYRSSYTVDGVKRWLGITQLESTNARKTFPCFDEPQYKATFQTTILAPSAFSTVLSNTKIARTETTTDGWVRTTFLETPKMSTYLLAFLVSDFEAGSREDSNGKEVGIWSKPDVKGFTSFALDSAKAIVSALGEFLGIDYYTMDTSLNFDHIAVPDFNAGAMENWGLITYREAYLIYDPAESSLRYRQQLVTIIAHETAHMWFGNLVTCHWWSNTWLNEGFANYLQYFIGAIVQPEMGLEEQFVLTSVQGALSVDQVPGSESLTNENVNSPAEISGHFGTITYSKGGSIIRMVEHLIGTDTLKRGLNSYLDANRFGSGYPDNLFEHLQQATNETDYDQHYDVSVTDIYKNWTVQSGFPLITVSANFSSGEVKVTQQRFYINPNNKSDEVYLVPLSFASKSEENHSTKPTLILKDKEATFNKDNIKQEWMLANVEQSGFYRVNYDTNLWDQLIKTLNSDSFEEIPVLNRAQIVDDVFALSRADVITYHQALDILQFLSRERSYFVWVPAISGFNFLRARLEISTEDLRELQVYLLDLISGVVADLGLEEREDDNYITLRNRMLILEFACSLGHEDCVANSIELFRKLSEDGTPIRPNQRPMAYCVGLKRGTHEDFLFLWTKYTQSIIESEKLAILGNLGCTAQKESIHTFLDVIFQNDSLIRKQDSSSSYSSAIQLKVNVQHVFEYVKQNYEQIRRTFSINTVLSGLAGSFTSEEDLIEFENWLKSSTGLLETEATAGVNAVATARNNHAWTTAHLDEIKNSVREHSSANTLFSSLTLAVTSLVILLNHL